MSRQTVIHLTNEHAEICKALDAFEAFLDRSTEETGPDRHELWALLDSLTESLFLRHEEKEETVLLPHLGRMGLSWTDGSLAHVRADHRHGRYLMRSLRQATHQLKDWSTEERRHFVAIGREWLAFLRHHMEQEETTLFPFLDAELTSEDDRLLMEQFAGIDADFEQMADSRELSEAREAFVRQYGAAAG